MARLRPHQPIIAITPSRTAVSQLALEWGVWPVYVPECADVEELWSRSLDAARESGIVADGDLVVITAGTAVNTPGTTNLIKVDYA